jgi:single-strand DNA-binding protein
MAKDLNHVAVIGRLVKDPEIKYTASGMPVTKFTIANNVTYMQNNERKDYVNFFDVNVWGNQAINCEKFLKKGSQVAIEGSLRQSKWTDAATGQNRSKIEITANSVQFLTPAGGAAQQQMSNSGSSNQFQQDKQTESGNQGFIEDPWNDKNNEVFIDNDPFSETMDSKDDIPF